MKGVKYNLVFHRLDNSVINMFGLKSSELMDTLPQLFKTHYGYELNCTQDLINSLHKRPNKVNKFVREKVMLVRAEDQLAPDKKHDNPNLSGNDAVNNITIISQSVVAN